MTDSNNSPQLYSDKKNHIAPEGADVRWLETDTGNLRYAIWQAGGMSPRGTVVFNHGLNEHIEKYFNVLAGLTRRGYVVVAHDWRNHGLSAPYADGDYFEQHDRDFTKLMDETVIPNTPGPHYAIAHSMGACLTLFAVKNHPEWFKKIVLCSPMLGIMAVRKMPMLKMLGKGMAFLPDKVRDLLGAMKATYRYTSSFGNFEAYQELIKNNPALKMDNYDIVRWFNSAINRTALMQKPPWLSQIKTPVLLLLAGDDSLVDNDVAINSGTYLANAELQVVDFALHELFMEAENYQEVAWGALDSFLQAQDSTSSAAEDASEQSAPPPPPPAKKVPDTLQFEIPSSNDKPTDSDA